MAASGAARSLDAAGGTGAVLTIRTVAATGSTNADLLAEAEAGAAEGAWLRAERQLAGRGRQGRPWFDPGGNLAISTLVRLRIGDPAAPTLALAAAVALHDAVDAATGGAVRIKWPNDLMVGTAKLSGILLERTAGDAVVIGFGVNVAHAPAVPGRDTVSLSDLGIAPTAAELADGLRAAFATWLSVWRTDFECLREAWLARAHARGTMLEVHDAGGTVRGRFTGLAGDGALLIEGVSGEVRAVHAGDVFACLDV